MYMHNVSENLQLYSLEGQLIMQLDMPDIGCVAGLSGRKQDSLGTSHHPIAPPALSHCMAAAPRSLQR